MPAEPHWLLILVYLGSGFLLLTKGADWLVSSSSQVARRIGISTLVVGLTIVAFGTSAPEIVVSSFAAAEGKVDLSLGNVLGSNIANIGLVLGACAVVLPKVLEVRLPLREVFWVFLSIAILWWAAYDHVIDRRESALLLLVSVVFLVHLWLTSKEGGHVVEAVGEYERPRLWIVIGIVAICFGAKLVVMGAEGGAIKIGIPQSVIGLTVVAVGTSLPELAAGLGGAIKGETDISLGNVVGSNVFNLVAVIGIVGLVQPLDPASSGIADKDGLNAAFAQALNEDFFVVLGFSLAAILLPRFVPGNGRAKGVLFLFAYALYTLWLFRSRAL